MRLELVAQTRAQTCPPSLLINGFRESALQARTCFGFGATLRHLPALGWFRERRAAARRP